MPKRSSYMNKQMREHQQNMAILDWLARDPEAKYFIGAGLGAGIGVLGKLTTPPPSDTSGGTNSGYGTVTTAQAGAFTWLMGPLNPVTMQFFVDKLQAAKQSDATVTGNMAGLPLGEIMTLAGTGFAGSCMAILFLKAIFGTGGMAEVLKGIGEIVPL